MAYKGVYEEFRLQLILFIISQQPAAEDGLSIPPRANWVQGLGSHRRL